jgi:hypothetical protein
MNLIDAMGVDFKDAKRWMSFGLFASVGIYLCLLTSAFLPPKAEKIFALVVLLLQVIILIAKVHSDDCYSCGEAIRRAALLQDGLGIQPTPLTVAGLCARRCAVPSGSRPYVGSYYASDLPTGPKRVAAIVLETVFWTSYLARRTSILLWCVVGASGLLILGFALAFMQWQSTASPLEVISRALIISFGFWTVGDWTILAWRYQVLARTTESLLGTCERLAQGNGPSDHDALIVLGEYNATLASGPPILQWIYDHYRDRLNAAWDAAYPRAMTAEAAKLAARIG